MTFWGKLVLVFLFLNTLGCSHCPCQADAKKSRCVRISFSQPVRSLNPSTGMDFPSAYVAKMLFEGLMIVGPDGTIKPSIAESYEISGDLKTYTFHLRPTKWSNGSPVTAYDFEYSWKKVINPESAAIGVYNFYIIQNAQAAACGRASLDSVGIKALDSKTLIVTLEHPTPYFLEVVASPAFLPVNATIDQNHPEWSYSGAEAFVSNGPYLLEKYLDEELAVKKNEEYWDAKNVSMPGIHVSIIKDDHIQLDLFAKKQLDWLGKPVSRIPLESIAHLKMKDKVRFQKTLGLYWCFVNTESFPFNHKKIRQAFAYALDRDLISHYILQASEEPAQSILPYYLSGQTTPFFQANQRELAQKLFNEALEELGQSRETLPPIILNHVSSPTHLCIAEALQKQWSEVFGICVKLENQDWRAHYGKLQGGNYQLGGMCWQSWLRDPCYILEAFRYKDDGENLSRWESKDFQQLLSSSEQATDPAYRKQLLKQAEDILLDEIPVIPIYFSTIAYGKNKKLKNVFISDLYDIDFRWSYFE